jgi:ABC-type Fe3+/spermidine/putrescine transport system ATPase subunit
MDDAFLQMNEVTKRFGQRTVVNRLSLSLTEGEIVALLGASGCGKSTTLRLIAGLEKLDDGEIWIGGKCVSIKGQNLTPPKQRGIGYVFQDLALWPHLTVAGNLDFVLATSGIAKRDRAQQIDEVLRLVRIERFARNFPGELSGGEQQRAAIARAIVARPRLLLLDEPLSSLDTYLKDDLLRELTELQNRLHVTTVYITHDPNEAANFAHRVVLMSDGKIVGKEVKQ